MTFAPLLSVVLAAFTFLKVDATPSMAIPPQFLNRTSVETEARFFYNTNGPSLTDDVGTLANGKVQFGYFTNWGVYSTGRNFPPQSIATASITHILYSFADSDGSSGAVKLSDEYADQQIHYTGDSWSDPGNNLYGAMKQLYLIKKANRRIKTLLSVGGWTYSQAGHFNFVTNAAARATFISTAITLLEDNGFDGIDIDFEYPSSTAQGNGLASLLTELRSALNSHASKKGDSVPYLLTVAVGAGPTGYQYLPISTMNSALSFWNLMAYDYAGSWSTVSDDQANVYDTGVSGFSTDAALNYYTSHGATASKITMGVPLYGRAFTNTNGYHQAYSGVGSGSWEAGIWDYKALPLSGCAITENTSKIISYCYSSGSKTFVSYDTPNIAVAKANYMKSKGLAGSMFWELSGDKTGADSLVTRVGNTLGGLDTENNHLNYPGSKWDNVRSQMGSTPGTPTTTSGGTTPTGGTCAGVAAWSASAVYTGGQQATYNGQLWQAQWWTQNEVPKAGDGLPWKLVRNC